MPLAAAAVAWLRGVHAAHVPDVLAAAAILTGLIFNVFVLLFDLSDRAAEKADAAHIGVLNRLADELRANVSYAVMLGLVLTAVLGYLAMFTDTDKPVNSVVTAVIIFLGLQMFLTISMILKRIRAMYRAFSTIGPERMP
jgi:hypothetical protein